MANPYYSWKFCRCSHTSKSRGGVAAVVLQYLDCSHSPLTPNPTNPPLSESEVGSKVAHFQFLDFSDFSLAHGELSSFIQKDVQYFTCTMQDNPLKIKENNQLRPRRIFGYLPKLFTMSIRTWFLPLNIQYYYLPPSFQYFLEFSLKLCLPCLLLSRFSSWEWSWKFHVSVCQIPHKSWQVVETCKTKVFCK